MNTITCDQAEQLIVRDLDEGLKSDEKARIEDHLRKCIGCVRFREEMKMILESAASDISQMPDENFWISFQNGLNACVNEKRNAKRRWWRLDTAGPIFAAAAAVIVAVMVFTSYVHHPRMEISSSDALIDDLNQAFGPSRDEMFQLADSDATMVLDVPDESVNGWFEIEEEPSRMFL